MRCRRDRISSHGRGRQTSDVEEPANVVAALEKIGRGEDLVVLDCLSCGSQLDQRSRVDDERVLPEADQLDGSAEGGGFREVCRERTKLDRDRADRYAESPAGRVTRFAGWTNQKVAGRRGPGAADGRGLYAYREVGHVCHRDRNRNFDQSQHARSGRRHSAQPSPIEQTHREHDRDGELRCQKRRAQLASNRSHHCERSDGLPVRVPRSGTEQSRACRRTLAERRPQGGRMQHRQRASLGRRLGRCIMRDGERREREDFSVRCEKIAIVADGAGRGCAQVSQCALAWRPAPSASAGRRVHRDELRRWTIVRDLTMRTERITCAAP